MQTRGKKFIINSGLSLTQQMVTMICGLILPQLVLITFGSKVNGTIASISQFVSFITLLQGGVGTVARIAFYKALASGKQDTISIAYKTISDFFKKFSIIFLIYLLGLSIVFPLIIKTGFDFFYISTLVLILGLASIFEYFFGQTSQMLLFSAQQGYVYSLVQIICTVLSTIIGVCLIQMGCTIHIVKFASAIFFIIRPLVLHFIVSKKYEIKKGVTKSKKLLKQRNAALVRHIAFYIHTSTDVMVLTLYSNVLWVSVYAVHRYVNSSLSGLVTSVLGNTEVVFGDIIARNDYNEMRKQVPIYDLFSKILSGSCFFTCIILISQFISVYTRKVTDINYYHPLFATILVLAEMIYCMGLTYQNVYIAAGHVKQTQGITIIEACLNLGISISLVGYLGIIGVAIGTLVAMTYTSVANIIYMKRHVFNMSFKFILKSYIVNLLPGVIITYLFRTIFYYKVDNFAQFFLYGLVVFAIVTFFIIVTNLLFFRSEMKEVIEIFRKKILKR